MAYSSQPPRHRTRTRHPYPLLGMGLAALLLGTLLLAPSLLLAQGATLGQMSQAVRAPALLTTALGAWLLLLHAWRSFSQRLNPPLAGDSALKGTGAVTLPPHPLPLVWNREVLLVIEWRRFEALVEKLFSQSGFTTHSQRPIPGGSVDIRLHTPDSSAPAMVVRCRHNPRQEVGVHELSEFLRVMASQGVTRGTFVTASTFSTAARVFARDNGISTQDGDGLLRMIARSTPEQQAELLQVATEGDYWRPTCIHCDVKMKTRRPKNGGLPHWACPHQPACGFTLPKRSRRH